ncbi:MAG: hypothetical protein KDI33_09170 [Halioglobus sp.]|nr:hypothetical protein [Halioglobus sp.]
MTRSIITAVPEFAPDELQAMHKFCLQYRELVRGGDKPSQYQDIHFMLYQVLCYAAGVAYDS